MPAGRPKIMKGLKPKHHLKITNKTRMLFDLEGVTWTEFSEAAGFSRRTMQMIFNDIEGRSLGTLKKFAEALGVKICNLFDETMEPILGQEESAATPTSANKIPS